MESENKIIHNVLMVTSSEMDVEKILPVIGNSTDTRKYISFEKIIPIPLGIENAFDFCRENWGTPTDTFSGQTKRIKLVIDNMKVLYITFNTSETPPLPIIKKISQLISYAEFDIIWKEVNTEKYNVGEAKYSNGEELFNLIPNPNSIIARNMYNSIK